MTASFGILYLFPNSIGHPDKHVFLPPKNEQVIRSIRHFIVENIRTTRRYLRSIDKHFPIDECHFFELNKHTPADSLSGFLKPLQEGFDMAIISESGSPAVADPGADVVRLAHQKQIKVVPLVGPSSILLALMASGLNGQRFTFNGYLPIEKSKRQKTIKQLEQRSRHNHETQIFIETPYRNNALYDAFLQTLASHTLLTVATDVNTPSEFIQTKTIRQWQQTPHPDIHKRNTIFLFLAE